MTRPELQVIEFNGSARSGKGTIVKYLCDQHPDLVTSEETGVDYRIITAGLLASGTIAEQMAPDEVTSRVSSLDVEELADVLNQRSSFLAQKDNLYVNVINGLVASVSRVPGARTAVKSDFKKRVAMIRDDDRYKVLLLDGRNLAPVIDDMAGIRIALRIFVDCSVNEAARREALRAGVEPDSPAGLSILDDLRQRSKHDGERQIDPVRPDPDAIDYWQASSEASPAVEAAQTGRQLLFDTTNVPKDKMLSAAELILQKVITN
jgi:cytidylate kinase